MPIIFFLNKQFNNYLCFGYLKNQVGDNKKLKLQMLPWSMLLDKNKPLPMLLTDDYFFFRGIININYINNNISSTKKSINGAKI